MSIDLTPTLNLIEAVFITLMLPGFVHIVYRAWCAGVVVHNQIAAKRNGDRLLVAWLLLVIYVGFSAALTFFLALGLQSAAAPTPTDPERARAAAVLVGFYSLLGIITWACAGLAGWLHAKLVKRIAAKAEADRFDKINSGK